MGKVEDYLSMQTALLEDKSNIQLNYENLLHGYKETNELPPVDVRIQAAFQELRQLKSHHLELRTRELFMKRILESKAFDELAPIDETGRIEVEVNQEKASLRQIKKSRAEAEKLTANSAIQLEKNIHQYKSEQKEAELLLRKARYTLRSSSVDKILADRDITKIENLVEDIDEVDGDCCDNIIKVLEEEKNKLKKQGNAHSENLSKIRTQVEELNDKVKNLDIESKKLEKEISDNDQKDSKLSELRHECKLQEQLEEIMAAISGIRVRETLKDGISFEVCAAAFLQDHNVLDQEKLIYLLDITFDEENLGETTIIKMAFTPSDVHLNDLCDEDLTLATAVQIACSRLIKHLEDKFPKM